MAADTFSVRDGMIVTNGVPTGLMRTARMYENFILELEWRHMKEGGNSGVFTWSDGLPAVGGPFPRGIEVQILDLGYAKQPGANEWFTTHGDIFPVRGATMTPAGRISKTGQRSFPIEDRTKPSPEWNHYRLVADRGELRLSVNGKEVTVGKDCVPRKGYLCLEAEGSECHFRNLRIKELPSSNTPPEQTANPYEGFRPLFNGKDFGGWKVDEAVKSVWSVRGSHFVSKGGVKGRKLDLWTEKSYRDFVLCVDWRLAKKPEAETVADLHRRRPLCARRPRPDRPQGDPPRRRQRHLPARRRALPGEHLEPADGFRRHQRTAQGREAARRPAPRDAAEGESRRAVRAMEPLLHHAQGRPRDRRAQRPDGDRQLPAARNRARKARIALQYHGDELEFANLFIREL